jgi:Raf kinase inhibitor-like YbhB/YbcL family protein
MNHPKATNIAIALLCFLILSPALAGCRGAELQRTQEGEAEMGIKITSSAFEEGSQIPKKYTCDGENVSPPVAWSGIPNGTKSLVLILNDPDAPSKDFVHWVLFNIPATTDELPEGAAGIGVSGTNGYRKTGYNGPCPPLGTLHRYFFTLYALDKELKLSAGATKADIETAIRGHLLASAQLIGKYGR